MSTEKILKNTLLSLLLVLLAVFSFFIVSDLVGGSRVSETLMTSIDDKTATVMKLTSASAVASAGISAIPGDTATPIAEKLADVTGYFLIVLSVLYTEKALLSLLGAAAFKLLIPAACAVGILSVWFWEKGRLLSKKLALFAVAILIAIPASLLISDAIYSSYSDRLNDTLDSTEELNEQTAPLAEAEDDSFLISGILGRISETASSLSDKAAKLLNRYVESVAILIVTSCIMPCLGLIFIIWLIKTLFGVDVIDRARSLGRKDRPDKNDHPDNS